MSDNYMLHGASQALLGMSDDDDMDYTTTDASGDDDVEILEEITEDDDEEEDDEYTDAEEGMEEVIQDMLDDGDLIIDDDGALQPGIPHESDDDDDVFEGEDAEEDEEDEAGEAEGGPRTTITITGDEIAAALEPATEPEGETLTIAEARQQMLRNLLRRPGVLRQLGLEGLFRNTEEDEEEVERQNARSLRARRRMQENPHPPITNEPQPNGTALMESGGFGINDRQKSVMSNRKKVASRIMQRELGLGSPGKERTHNRLVSQELLPSSTADTIINYDYRCYSGQFSEDGNFYFTCGQDMLVRMYDTSNPYNWRLYKTVQYYHGAWTISDATLSPDNKWLAYSSLRHIVSLASTDPETDAEPHLLDISDMHGNQRTRHNGGRREFGIFSVRFSGDGTELVCGTNSHSVYVYDLESRKSIVRISAHDDEVNAVCYGDQSSPHILYSGSDDSTIKVWDRRSLGDGRAAGCFLGHTEGVTYIDSKGDGRYVLSNGKDQRMKLWDLRKMSPPETCSMRRQTQYMADNFDYRGDDFEQHPYKGPHPDDTSVVTYRGHRVAKTLIRCHFSPQGSTDSRYVYTGSADGKVHIFNIDGTLAKKIDVNKASYGSRPKTSGSHRMYWGMDSGSSWSTCVRDVSWHPNAPVLAATAWNGWGGDCGTCTTHTWNDGLEEDEGEPMGKRVNAKLQRDPRYYGEPAVRSASGPGMATRAQRRRALEDEEDEVGEDSE